MAEIKDCCSCIYATRSTFTEPCVSCGVDFQNYVAKPTPKRKLKTNADRIRAMTDEELAEFMCHNVSNGTVNCAFCAAAEFCRMGHNGWLGWLREEVTDGKQD